MVTILGIKLSNRQNNSLKFQEILTEFGCTIRTRIGLHPSSDGSCHPDGIILLEIVDDKIVSDLENKLAALENLEIQKMMFEH